MERNRNHRDARAAGASDAALELDALLHPANAFASPADVVNDPDLTLYEKRAILASWASDACAVEAAPDLRRGPEGRTVRFDDVMDALRALDRLGGDVGAIRRSDRRAIGSRAPYPFRRRRGGGSSDDCGHSLN
jgi:hypothetical protein